MDFGLPLKPAFDNVNLPSYGAATSKSHLKQGNCVWLTAGIIIADVVGAGVLSFANAIARFGWLLGSVITVALLAMNIHISILMWRVRMGCPRATTYPELAAEAFAGAPDDVRQFAVKATAAVQYGLIAGMLGIYTLSLGLGYGRMFHDVYVCMPLWTCIGCGSVIVFFASGRALGTWPSLICLNVATIVGTVTIPLVIMAIMGLKETRRPDSTFDAVADLSITGSLSGISTITFAMTSQFMVVEIIDEMKDPIDFPKAYLWISAPFQLTAFLAVGLGGYYYAGSDVHGMIMDNIPFGTALRLAALCLVLHMLVTFVIKGVVLARAVHKAVDEASVDTDDARGWGSWILITFGITAFSWLFAQLVPFFEDMVDLLGASLGPAGCYIIPIILYVRWLRDFAGTDQSPGRVESFIISAEFVLGMTLMCFGTASALSNIYSKWQTYGYPFACHCENTWNVCECSASHVGMEHCLLP